MLRNILASILFRKKTISTILLMIVLLGVLSYVTFPKEEMPEIDLKTVALIVEYKGMSSSEIEKLITEPLERKLMSLQDIDEIVSIGNCSKDSNIRPNSNQEKLDGLKLAFDKNGTVTAATSSPLTDGAAATLICEEQYLSLIHI